MNSFAEIGFDIILIAPICLSIFFRIPPISENRKKRFPSKNDFPKIYKIENIQIYRNYPPPPPPPSPDRKLSRHTPLCRTLFEKNVLFRKVDVNRKYTLAPAPLPPRRGPSHRRGTIPWSSRAREGAARTLFSIFVYSSKRTFLFFEK